MGAMTTRSAYSGKATYGAACAVAALLLALAVASIDAQIAYDGNFRLYYTAGSSYCYINTTTTLNPMTCASAPLLSQATAFSIVAVSNGGYVQSPTTPGILNGGAQALWCTTRNNTGYSNNGVFCYGSTLKTWFQLIKTGGLGSNYIYNDDTVVIRNNFNGANCSVNAGVVYCDPSSSLTPATFKVAI